MLAKKMIYHLTLYGYYPENMLPKIWYHCSRPTENHLCVDNFGIKPFPQDDTTHLIKALRDLYDLTVDHTCDNYYSYNIKWNLEISMSKLVSFTLDKPQHQQPSKSTTNATQ